MPVDAVLNTVMDGVSGENSAVAELMQDGRTQEAATLVFAYISMINVPDDMVCL